MWCEYNKLHSNSFLQCFLCSPLIFCNQKHLSIIVMLPDVNIQPRHVWRQQVADKLSQEWNQEAGFRRLTGLVITLVGINCDASGYVSCDNVTDNLASIKVKTMEGEVVLPDAGWCWMAARLKPPAAEPQFDVFEVFNSKTQRNKSQENVSCQNMSEIHILWGYYLF